jgi:excisionase family DNA binding protein
MIHEEQQLRVPEACALLAVNEKTLREMIKRGTLTALNFGPKTTRIPLKAIKELTNPPQLFNEAREALYSELNAALGLGDLGKARRANAANKWLSCARDDLASGQPDSAKYATGLALKEMPNCAALVAYGDSL